MPKAKRDRLIAGLGNGELDVLTSCDLISEGLDVPALGAVILLRPTASLVLFLQQVGRGMRPAPDKPPLVVVDHVGNIARHGLPDTPRKWTLDGDVTKEKETAGICPRCGYVNETCALFCANCNLAFEGHGYGSGGRRIPHQVDGSFVEITDARRFEILRMTRLELWQSDLCEAELVIAAQQRGYKPGWVYHRLQERQRR